jgi:hypothetical protein
MMNEEGRVVDFYIASKDMVSSSSFMGNKFLAEYHKDVTVVI